MTPLDVAAIRARFPALSRTQDGVACVFADAPGGTQVPDVVIEAMSRYLRDENANTWGAFPTSRATNATVDAARLAAADLMGCDPDEVVFGTNMTTLAFSLARAIRRTLAPGDEIVVTMLDHDANVAPWLVAARDAGATVRWVDVNPEDCTLDLDSLDHVLGRQTKLVAFTLASNALGTITPATEIVRRAHAVGALAVADAVHLAPHRSFDLRALGADVLFCSPYKFFGPHLGIMAGTREVLALLQPDKVRPASDSVPDRWETGTKNHEGLAGLVAAIDYLAGLGEGATRRDAIRAGMERVTRHEARLSDRFLRGLPPKARLLGIGDPGRVAERAPTFALRVGEHHPRADAEALARRGIFAWDGDYYAQAIMQRLDLADTGGALRIGFCHYHTLQEIDRVLEAITGIADA